MKGEFQVDSELVKLSGGCFEVYCDNDLVFSKNKLGRFPHEGEIVELLQSRLA